MGCDLMVEENVAKEFLENHRLQKKTELERAYHSYCDNYDFANFHLNEVMIV